MGCIKPLNEESSVPNSFKDYAPPMYFNSNDSLCLVANKPRLCHWVLSIIGVAFLR